MPRFLIFPPLFALWFAIAQFGLTVLWQVSFFLTLRFIAPNHVRFRLTGLSEWPLQFYLRAFITGLVVGGVFAALDFVKHREKLRAEETLLRLLPNLLKSGTVGVALVLLYYGAFYIPLSLHLSRIPRTVYTPYRAISSWSIYTPPILLFVALLWAMRKTLQQTRQSP